MNPIKRIGVYPGSFNPFHVGHLNITEQALVIFDEVIIARGWNPEKEKPESVDFPTNNDIVQRCRIDSFKGLLADYLNLLEFNEYDKVFVIRGLRNGEDLQYEQNQLQYIKEMYPTIRPVFLMCDRKYEHISSQSLRSLRKVSEEEYQKYIPK